MKKRLLALLLMFSMLLSVLPAAVLADEQTEDAAEFAAEWNFEEPELRDTEMVLVPDDYAPDGEILQYDPPMAANDDSELSYELLLLQDMCSTVREALLSGTTKISLSNIDILYEDSEQFNHIGYYCPYFDGSNITADVYYYSSGKYAYLTISNNLSADETKAWIDQVDAAIDELLSLIDDDSLSVENQALILHDYMAVHYHYDTSLAKFYPGIMLTEHTGVCQSYAYLFQYLMNRKGIVCYYAASTSMKHGWDILKIGDSYYHVDITWDDPTSDQFGQVRHQYFLLSDDTIESGDSIRTKTHYGWDITAYACTDSSYEDDYYVSAVSPVVISGDLRYFVDESGLECYNTTSAQTTLKASMGKWYLWDSTTSAYTAVFSGLWEDHGKLFYNTASAIMTYDLSSGTSSIYAAIDNTDGYVYGSMYEDGTIYYALQTTPSVAYDSKDIRTVTYTPVHVYNAGIITTAATCTADGVKIYTCTACGAAYTEAIAKLGHNYQAVVTVPTCTAKGYTTYTCSRCQDSYAADYTDALGHSYNSGVITTAATCTTAGVKTYTCFTCGAAYTEAIAKLGHNYQAVVTSPTCTAKGYTTYTCSRCQDSYTADYTDALGHSYNSGVITTTATCTAAGVKTYTCSTCGTKKTESIPATGHSYNSGVITTAATCASDGVKTFTCTVCGGTKTEAIPKTSVHTWDSGTVTTPATDATDGVTTYTCTVCGITKTEVIPATGSPFSDVQNSSRYYYQPVLWAVSKGITTGFSDGTFRPDENCTRGQIVTFLWRAYGSPNSTTTVNPFTDVSENSPFYKAILWAVEQGITTGYSDGTFRPGNYCTRGQAVTFMYRAANEPEVMTSTNPFPDVSESSYYYKAILWASENGITSGYEDGTFRPGNTCTRAQIVTFLYRYYNETAHVESDTISPLREQISEMVSGYSGIWSVYFKRLDTGEYFTIHDTPMVAASLIKLYVYGTAAKQMEAGKLSSAAYSDSMQYMISASDNNSCNILVDAVGGTSVVNDFIQSQSWTDTVMNRKMLQAGSENYTSVSECGNLLERVYNGTYVSAETSEGLLNAMLSQYRRTKIPAGIPSGTKCANKTGELSDVENDAAIVYSSACDYILVVMSDDISAAAAQSEIREISSAVYDYLNEAQ